MKFSDLVAWDNTLKNWKAAFGYWAEIKHGLMGNFPIIPVDEKEKIVICFSKEDLKKVWETLKRKETRLHRIPFLVNSESRLAVCLNKQQYYPEPDSKDFFFVFNTEEAEKHIKSKSFKWASGLFGADNPNAIFPEKAEEDD